MAVFILAVVTLACVALIIKKKLEDEIDKHNKK